MPLIEEVEHEYNSVRNDSKFKKEFDYYLKNYVGRPSPLFLPKELLKISEELKFISKEMN